jgi:hypothetical protein
MEIQEMSRTYLPYRPTSKLMAEENKFEAG